MDAQLLLSLLRLCRAPPFEHARKQVRRQATVLFLAQTARLCTPYRAFHSEPRVRIYDRIRWPADHVPMFRQFPVADSEDFGNRDLRRTGTRDIAGVHEDKITFGDGANNFPFGLGRSGNQLAQEIDSSCRCTAGSVLTMFDEIWGRVAREGLRRFEILEGQLVERQYDRFRTFRGRSVARARRIRQSPSIR